MSAALLAAILEQASNGDGGAVFEIAATSRYESTAAATSHTMDAPDGTAVGDLLIAICAQSQAGSTAFTPPSGWSASAAGHVGGFWKIADSGDLGSLTWTLAAARNMGAVIARITGAHATDPIAHATITSANPSNLASPWGAGDFIGITAWGSRGTAAQISAGPTPPTGTTLIESSPSSMSSTIGGTAWMAAMDLSAVSAWDPGTWTVTTADATGARSFTFLIRPA